MTDSSTLLLLVRMGFSLLLILGMIAGTSRLMRRRGRVTGSRRADNTSIDVIARRSVGRRSNLLVIRIAERELLVGTSDTTVSLVADLTAVPSPAPAPTSDATPEPAAVPLIELAEFVDLSTLDTSTLDTSAPDTTGAAAPGLLGAIRDLTVRRS